MSKYFAAKVLLITLALGGIGAFAAQNPMIKQALSFAKPDVKVAIGGFVDRNGQPVSVEKTESVKTGELIDWAIESKNEGTADAENYRVVGQIPNGTAFVAGSVRAEQSPVITYSIDGGKTFAAEPMIDEKQPDGSIRKVPAPPTLYTQIKFEWNGVLAARSSVNVSYRVKVK